jgi:hypothetical protein
MTLSEHIARLTVPSHRFTGNARLPQFGSRNQQAQSRPVEGGLEEENIIAAGGLSNAAKPNKKGAGPHEEQFRVGHERREEVVFRPQERSWEGEL